MNLNERNMMEEEVGERESPEKRREDERKRKRKDEEEEKGREKQRDGVIKRTKVENEELEAVRLRNEEEERKRKEEEEEEEEEKERKEEEEEKLKKEFDGLFFAAQNGDEQTVQLFLEKGKPNIDLADQVILLIVSFSFSVSFFVILLIFNLLRMKKWLE